MSGNRFGTLFQYQTWGESHGPAIGCVVDGVPPRLNLSEADIQVWLDKRKPGQNRFATQRREPDTVKIMSGVFEGQTTGTPISLMIENEDARSKDYGDIKDKYRPSHADYSYDAKYGIRDYRGGGRSSARETAMRVAAGAVARKILSGVIIRGAVVQIGPHKICRDNWDWDQVEKNPFWSPDKRIVDEWEHFLDERRKAGSSAGAIVEVHASGVPAGWGAPVYDRLDADLAKAMMSINAVKGVEIGAGFECVAWGGEKNADQMRMSDGGKPQFLSNHAGGILGGISTGQDIVVRMAFKPTSSILTPVQTITRTGEDTDIVTKGRHDPCVGIRGAPVAEAMMACVLADHWLRHKAQCL
ncbi:MAG: chorismate synthase [Micavibrio aeruginosavorus]|uniref:Chorismate synthase n=1 Tax=Micavibrio aeruginosavorus TaxID=349221 RepID=A0A7T5UHP4_9BACT|nr:MAG: chorismate synthase [Micavibrio aeruginosavorus]